MRPTTIALIAAFTLASCTPPQSHRLRLAEPPAAGTAERAVARRAEARLAVDEVHASVHRIGKTAEELGGHLNYSDSTQESGTIRLTVPSPGFDDFMLRLASIGTVEHKRIVAEDVTERTAQLESQLARLRAQRDQVRMRVRNLAAPATSVSAEQEQLRSLQDQIDATELKLSLARGESALTTVELQLYRPIVLGPVGLLFRTVGIGVRKLFIWS